VQHLRKPAFLIKADVAQRLIEARDRAAVHLLVEGQCPPPTLAAERAGEPVVPDQCCAG
jgi:hypothetical protein